MRRGSKSAELVRSGYFSWAAWHVAAAVLLALIPSRILLGDHVWSHPANRTLLLLGLPLCYLAAALITALVGREREKASVLYALNVIWILFGGLYLMLLVSPGQWFSRSLILVGSVLAMVFLMVPILLGRIRAAPLTVLAGLIALLIADGLHSGLSGSDTQRMMETEVIQTVREPLRVVSYANYIQTPFARGGGLAVVGQRVLLVTGDGVFYSLEWHDEEAEASFRAVPLSLKSPIDRTDFMEVMPDEFYQARFRVAGFFAEEIPGDSLRLLVSHHHWDSAENCYALQVSEISLPARALSSQMHESSWKQIYRTRPCLTLHEHERGHVFGGLQSGGQLAKLEEDALLLTVGDHQRNGWYSDDLLPQDMESDYGKTLLLRGDGTATIYSSGHRNPQGLYIDSAGRVWMTDHGPHGGDQLNIVTRGANYGWPLQTFGTDYGDVVWPLEEEAVAGATNFELPVYAWTPSIAPTSVVSIGGRKFRRWRGDLLIGSLGNRALHRVRLVGERVIYVEPIRIGRRIRAVVKDPDGRLVVWTDEAEVLRIEPAMAIRDGAAIFQRCTACHGVGSSLPGRGPNLDGIYGRRVASDADFAYSDGLRARSGRWSEAWLDAFLTDSRGFAPGSAHGSIEIEDSAEREILIEFLKTL